MTSQLERRTRGGSRGVGGAGVLILVVSMVASGLVVLLATPAAADPPPAVPTITGWNGGNAVVSEQNNTLVVNAPGSNWRVVEIAAERSPAGANTWTDVVNEFPYYQQVATTDQTNLPFTVTKGSFQAQ